MDYSKYSRPPRVPAIVTQNSITKATPTALAIKLQQHREMRRTASQDSISKKLFSESQSPDGEFPRAIMLYNLGIKKNQEKAITLVNQRQREEQALGKISVTPQHGYKFFYARNNEEL